MPSPSIATLTVSDLNFSIRTEKHGDEDVINEVIASDCYRLRGLKAAGYEPRTILDVGAHIGTFSVLAHQLWPSAQIYAFEPNARSFELLCLNAPFAVRCKAGVRYDKANLLTDGEGATGGGFLTTRNEFDLAAANLNPDAYTYEVFAEDIRTMTLEEIFDVFGIEDVDLLKLDCEGSEIDCLKNMRPETAEKIRLTLGEYHTDEGFAGFRELAEKALPHLEFYGGNEQSIGPFWSKPRSATSAMPRSEHPSPLGLMDTFFHPLRVFSLGRGDFQSLRNSNVLFYFPHGFGDWVQFTSLSTLLDPTNNYWMTRFGDDNTSVLEGHPTIKPLYLGASSAHGGDGAAYQNRHFGLLWDQIDGTSQDLQLPSSLVKACQENQIDTLFWNGYPEVHGRTEYPYHTKARNLIPYLADSGQLRKTDLSLPLPTLMNFEVAKELQGWVETRLRNFTGWGRRKMCVICRNGYTSVGKNWAHMFREDLPPGQRVEGQECRDFMKLMLRKDPNWMFLIIEDRLFEGEHTVRDPDLNSYSYAELFGSPDTTTIPFGWILKAIMNCAALSIGVPAGPYHLSVTKADLPSIGLWIEHLPSWYDEPKEASLHLVSRNVRDRGLFDHAGSFFKQGNLEYKALELDTRIIPGEVVLNAVEQLLGPKISA